MNKGQKDIEDSEIRIVSQRGRTSGIFKNRKIWGLGIVVVSLVALVVCTVIAVNRDNAEIERSDCHLDTVNGFDMPGNESEGHGYALATDTVIANVRLTLITPVNCTPTLVEGVSAIDGEADAIVCQGPDLRADNGRIAGMCIVDGKLLSRGESKAGYCAIIDGNISLGISQTAPELEQVIETGGSFFRQYPLVAGKQVVQNKPKGKSIRKALALVNGRYIVIVSRNRLTFEEFSEALCGLGADIAIYLAGSDAPGYYMTKAGHKEYIGRHENAEPENMVFLVWR